MSLLDVKTTIGSGSSPHILSSPNALNVTYIPVSIAFNILIVSSSSLSASSIRIGNLKILKTTKYLKFVFLNISLPVILIPKSFETKNRANVVLPVFLGPVKSIYG